MIFPSKGIVLRNVRYGDNSAVVSVYTREFGMQSYLVNGLTGKPKGSRNHFFQPAAQIDMQVYHNPLKNLQRIREVEWHYMYHNIFSDVSRHTAALLIVELMQKTILHEEQNYPVFDFAAATLANLDSMPAAEAANVPVFFAIKWPSLLGFQIQNNYKESRPFFDVKEGAFVESVSNTTPDHTAQTNATLAAVLGAGVVPDLTAFNLNGSIRKKILLLMEQYLRWHVDGFRELNTLRIHL